MCSEASGLSARPVPRSFCSMPRNRRWQQPWQRQYDYGHWPEQHRDWNSYQHGIYGSYGDDECYHDEWKWVRGYGWVYNHGQSPKPAGLRPSLAIPNKVIDYVSVVNNYIQAIPALRGLTKEQVVHRLNMAAAAIDVYSD